MTSEVDSLGFLSLLINGLFVQHFACDLRRNHTKGSFRTRNINKIIMSQSTAVLVRACTRIVSQTARKKKTLKVSVAVFQDP